MIGVPVVPVRLLLALLGCPPAVAAGLPELTPAALQARLADDIDAPLVLDLRPSAAFTRGHIEGAVNAGADPSKLWLDDAIGQVVLVVPRDSPRLAPWVARIARPGRALGLLAGGIDGWRAAGLPLVEAASPPQPRRSFVVPRGICEPREPVMIFNR